MRNDRHDALRLRPAAAVLLVASVLGSCASGRPLARSSSSPAAAAPAVEPEPDWAALAAVRLPLLAPCERPPAQETLLCGTLEVPENRADPAGRTLRLAIVVVPARSLEPPNDPIFVFEGGPGGAATARAPGFFWADAVRTRDVVLVDQRGTGGSNLLQCDLGGERRPGELGELFPAEAVAACAKALSARADLRFYTSAHFADDVEDVRRALGYGPINIRGASYGTWAMMTFAQRHPQSTRTLFGIGLDSPRRSNLAERGRWADATLAGLARLCRLEPECAALTPALDASVAALLASLDAGPRPVELAGGSPARGGRRTLLVGRAWLAEQLRLLLYYVFTSRALPWAVHRAERGDWEPLVELAVRIEAEFRSDLAAGVLLTVQCSEHLRFDVGGALAREARTLFGGYRLEQQVQACAHWPHAPVDPLGVPAPRPLPIPALLLSGRFDPVTPPAYGDETAALLPQSRHVVLERGQHGPFDLEGAWGCVHGLWAQLLDRGTVADLDLACVDDITRPPFLIYEAEFRAHLDEVLPPAR
jgi:pimeloyl-ACP methyl ester carboxylesterase